MFTRRAINYLYNYGAYVVSFINYVGRTAAYIRSEKNAPVVRRFICWIICLGLLVSNTPASTAMIGWRPSKSRARLTHQPPERKLPGLDRSSRLTPAIPKMLSQVSVWNKPVKKNNRVVDLLTNAMSYAWPGSFLAFGMSSLSDLSSDADKVRGETRNTFTSTPSRNKSAATATESVGRSRSANTAAPMFQSGDDNWPMAMLAPINRVGLVGGEDLLSRNYNWTLPLVDLPGRAELNLNLSLSLNSLIWTKSGGNIHFNKAGGFPSPGFHLGFPELKTYFYNSEAGVGSRLVIMPSGKSFEFWENPALQNGFDYIYEERNGSNMIIVETPGLFDPNETVWSLLTPDGTAYKYVVVGSNPKCVEIKDRNGNYISVAYNTATEKITRVIDTLERKVDFNYDNNNRLTSITQNWGGATHTWATFAYSTVTISAGFLSLNMVGAQNGQTIPVLSRVGLDDGSVHSFEYNTYGQVHTIRKYAPDAATPGSFPDDYTQLSYVTYDLPRDGSGQQNDCPRFITRKDWAHNWNNNNEVTTRFAGDLSSWGSVTTPDGVIYKEFFGAGGTWQRGLTTGTETWSGEVKKKWTTQEWTQDNTGLVYPLNPRLREANVYDDANNRRRTRMSYTSFGLVSDIDEYAADATTVLRKTHRDYDLSAVYTSRQIIGLPSAEYLYDGNNTLFSKVTYKYDLDPDPDPYLEHQGPPVQHDTANYGPDFVQGRGNLNKKLRWDVTAPTNESKASEYETGYNTSGSVIFTRDPLGHRTSIIYDDSFSDGQNDRNTYAYPTRMTDPDTFTSKVQYNYDFGAVTRTEDPKGVVVTWIYDEAGRIERMTNVAGGAYTRYIYAPNQLSVQSFTTINDLTSEFRQLTVTDGRGRIRGVASEHPGSAGGYKAQVFEYDVMGRQVRQTNPTEISNPTESDVNWTAAGDDKAAGWRGRSQAYDWQSRLTVTTNQDGTTRTISYDGCGCAGGQVVTLIDEMGRMRDQTYDILGRRLRERTYYDALITPEPFDLYTTTTNTYNVRDQITNINVTDNAFGGSQDTVMTYDGHGRLKTSKNPIESAATSFVYNPDDTLQMRTDARGATTTYGYNNRHLTTNLSYGVPSGVASTPNVSFGYDEAGRRLWMDDGPGRVDYEYNPRGILNKETRRFDELPAYQYELSYEYNLQNLLRSVTTKRNGAVDTTLNFDYDQAGRLATVYGSGFGGSDPFHFTSPSSPIKYRAWDAVKQKTYGNNRTMNVSYNNRLQVTGVEMPGLMSATYAYNNDGQIARIDDDWQQPDPYYPWLSRLIKARYNYDDLGRVSSADDFYAPFHQHFMLYNGFGNITHISKGMGAGAPGASYTTTFVNNRDQSPDVEYDQAGNTTRIKSAQYSFDAEGRPTYQSDLNLSLSYDGDGSQIKETQSNSQTSITRYFLRSSVMGGSVLADLNQSGDKIYNYIYANGEVIAEYNPTGQPLPDHTFGPKGVQLKERGSEPVLWTHADPSQRIHWTTRSDGAETSHWYLDEVGNLYRTGPDDNAAADYFLAIFLDQVQSAFELPLALFGNGRELIGGCSIGGVRVSCSLAYSVLNGGGPGFRTPPTFPGNLPGPVFRTPPTFPGNLPGIPAARGGGLGGFRTPPFVGGFLASGSATPGDVGLFPLIPTFAFMGGGQSDPPKMAPGQKRHCDKLAELMNEILYGVQKGSSWVKGIFERIEQQASAPNFPDHNHEKYHGPGSSKWKGHRKQLNDRREELKWNLKKWENSNCGPPPPRVGEALEKSQNRWLEDEWNRRQNPSARNVGPDVPFPIPIPPFPPRPPVLAPRAPVLIFIPRLVICALNPAYCREPQVF